MLGLEGGVVDPDGGLTDTIVIDDGDAGDAGDAGDGSIGAHDEDGDSVPDSMDNCPATPNTNQASNDLVGTACDPRPTEQGDNIVLFLPFYPAGRPAEIMNSMAVFANDYVELDGKEIRTVENFRPLRIAIEMDVVNFALSNARFDMILGARQCRIEECGAAMACIVAVTGSGSTMTPLPLGALEGTLTLTQTATQLECTVTRGGDTTTAMGAVTSLSSDNVRLRSENATVRVMNMTIFDAPKE